MRLTGGRVFDPLKGFVQRDVCVEDGLIAADAGGETVDVSGCWVIPGLTDLHFHGCRGADYSDGDAAGLQTMADYELSRGVGHYVGGDYEGAKRDFAIRAGLVPQKELFSQEQLAEIHRCVETVRDMDLPMTVKREERMDGILEQIRRAVPDLDARIGQAQNEDGQIADQALWSQTM